MTKANFKAAIAITSMLAFPAMFLYSYLAEAFQSQIEPTRPVARLAYRLGLAYRRITQGPDVVVLAVEREPVTNN